MKSFSVRVKLYILILLRIWLEFTYLVRVLRIWFVGIRKCHMLNWFLKCVIFSFGIYKSFGIQWDYGTNEIWNFKNFGTPYWKFFIYICIVCINCNWEWGTLYLIEIINFYISDPFWCGLVWIFTFYVYNCVSDDESSMYLQIFKSVLADFQLR